MRAEQLSEDVKGLLARFPGPVVLRQEEYKQAHFVAVGLLLAGLGALVLSVHEWSWSTAHYGLAGVSLVIFGLYMTIEVIVVVATGGMWMKLDADGIEYRFWMRRQPRRWAWESAKNFGVMYFGFNRVVTFEDSTKAKWWELNRILSYGGGQRLPNVTDLNDEDLAQLVNLWRARALTPTPANI
jgi:hypothetical protein